MGIAKTGSAEQAYAPRETVPAEDPSARGKAEQLNRPGAQNGGETLAETLRQSRERAQQRRDSLKIKVNPSQYGDAAMTAYSRLSAARTQAQVSAAAGYAQRQIVRFHAALHSDSENSERIKSAIRQLKKAVGRAGKKKRELRQEELLRARQKRAQLENRRRRALSLRRELSHRRTMRTLREAGYMRETDIENRLQDQLAQTRMELRAQAQELSGTLSPSAGAAAQGYAAQASPPPAPDSSVDLRA